MQSLQDKQLQEFTPATAGDTELAPMGASKMNSIMFDEQAFANVQRIANALANSRVTVPQHLQKNEGDCMAIVMQAMVWGMNPWPVAQKTHLVNGNLGYEAQLVNAVINSMAPTTGRINYEWFGDWERVVGNFIEKTSQKGNKYMAPNWNFADEKGLGVRVWATMKGEEEPRVLELLLSQAQPRNSTLWASDPKQQLAYLAVKRWARLYCPDVILGVYTPDEFEAVPTERDISGAGSHTTVQPDDKPKSRTSSLKNKVKSSKKKAAEPETDQAPDQVADGSQELFNRISIDIDDAQSEEDLAKAVADVEKLDDERKAKARFAYKFRLCQLRDLPVSIEVHDGIPHIVNTETGDIVS